MLNLTAGPSKQLCSPKLEINWDDLSTHLTITTKEVTAFSKSKSRRILGDKKKLSISVQSSKRL